MNLSDILSEAAVSKLQVVDSAIADANEFAQHKMINYTLSELGDSYIPLAHMNEQQSAVFQGELISTFKYRKWMPK